MDSPGFCAQYCSYTMMEDTSKKILSIITMDKRATDKKSTNLEKACFQLSLDALQEKGLQIKEVVTDAHMQVTSLMKKSYPGIKHSHDMWHAAKNLCKKIVKAGQNKECKGLLKWTSHIVNHFWYSCQKASGIDEFLEIWCGVIHHTINEHTWGVVYGRSNRMQCDHGPLAELSDDREYLQKNSTAHLALRNIVFDKAFLKKIHYLLNYRSTADLESFQQHILMYASKRNAYTPPAYRARNILAALDHNAHHDRGMSKIRRVKIYTTGNTTKRAADGLQLPLKRLKPTHTLHH
ncbi:uncharacterized protein [Ptychodera flava]|uniref:uncharacterized protein n=1 Tax=Ptychodera flava TaxID=63121 RepID=UPI003969CA3E